MKITRLFKTPDAVTLASLDLEEAKRQLLATQSQAEHSAKMVEYYQGVVTRLSQYVQSELAQADAARKSNYPNPPNKPASYSDIHLNT